jgi:hypothetical protein
MRYSPETRDNEPSADTDGEQRDGSCDQHCQQLRQRSTQAPL